MKLLSLLSVLVVAAGLSRAADDIAVAYNPKAPPVPAGAKATVVLDRAQYFLGESVRATFVIENTGTEPFPVSFGSDYSGAIRAERFKVTATDEAGRPVLDPNPESMSMGGLGFTHSIAPGAKHTEEVALLRYCQFDRPGRYTVRITHDLGWKKSERPHPVGEATITFAQPDAAQAEKIVATMEKSPELEDFEALHLPIYLEPLRRRAEAGNKKALAGLGSVESKEATEVLIQLAKGKKRDFALQAALVLNARLPDPVFNKQLPGRGPFQLEQTESRQRLSKITWDERFSAEVRALALEYLAAKENQAVSCGAFMVEAIGTPKEAPAVKAAIERALGATRVIRNDPEANILHVPDPLLELERAMQMLHQRGYELGADLKGGADIYLYFHWLAGQPGPRTDGWRKRFEASRGDSSFVVREAVLRSIPRPMPEECVGAVMKGMTDRDLGVRRAACEVAGESGDARFVKPLLDVIASSSHEWVLREANSALWSLKARFEKYQAWAARMADDGMLQFAFEELQGVIQEHPLGGGSRGKVTKSERLAIQAAWQTFLAKHEKELREGQHFNFGHPELTPDLFGRARWFYLPDGKQWPPPIPGSAAEDR